MIETRKPLGRKAYGSIPHLPGSRLGPGDHSCHEGQLHIATIKTRDRHDEVIVQEKLDGSNTAVAKIGDDIYALTRKGYLATTSPYAQHHVFARWVETQRTRFLMVLRNGERLCGEWLYQAHGTRYRLAHEPWVTFDLMTTTRSARGDQRTPYDEFVVRVQDAGFVIPSLLSRGSPISVDTIMAQLADGGMHGALDPVEGAVWRVERNQQITQNSSERRRVVDFLVKYVRPDKRDGSYLPEISGQIVLNERT